MKALLKMKEMGYLLGVIEVLSERVGPVVARSTEDREVRGSNPTLA